MFRILACYFFSLLGFLVGSCPRVSYSEQIDKIAERSGNLSPNQKITFNFGSSNSESDTYRIYALSPMGPSSSAYNRGQSQVEFKNFAAGLFGVENILRGMTNNTQKEKVESSKQIQACIRNAADFLKALNRSSSNVDFVGWVEEKKDVRQVVVTEVEIQFRPIADNVGTLGRVASLVTDKSSCTAKMGGEVGFGDKQLRIQRENGVNEFRAEDRFFTESINLKDLNELTNDSIHLAIYEAIAPPLNYPLGQGKKMGNSSDGKQSDYKGRPTKDRSGLD